MIIYDSYRRWWGNHSINGQGPEDAVSLPVCKHFHCHFDRISVQQILDPVAEVPVLLIIVAELIQVVQVHSIHEVASLPIVGKQPDLGKLALETFVHADQVELVNRPGVFTLSINQLILALVVELEGLTKLSSTWWSDFHLDVVFAIFALLWIESLLLRGREDSWAKLV